MIPAYESAYTLRVFMCLRDAATGPMQASSMMNTPTRVRETYDDTHPTHLLPPTSPHPTHPLRKTRSPAPYLPRAQIQRESGEPHEDHRSKPLLHCDE
jgi:hypothetical protein